MHQNVPRHQNRKRVDNSSNTERGEIKENKPIKMRHAQGVWQEQGLWGTVTFIDQPTRTGSRHGLYPRRVTSLDSVHFHPLSSPPAPEACQLQEPSLENLLGPFPTSTGSRKTPALRCTAQAPSPWPSWTQPTPEQGMWMKPSPPLRAVHAFRHRHFWAIPCSVSTCILVCKYTKSYKSSKEMNWAHVLKDAIITAAGQMCQESESFTVGCCIFSPSEISLSQILLCKPMPHLQPTSSLK